MMQAQHRKTCCLSGWTADAGWHLDAWAHGHKTSRWLQTTRADFRSAPLRMKTLHMGCRILLQWAPHVLQPILEWLCARSRQHVLPATCCNMRLA